MLIAGSVLDLIRPFRTMSEPSLPRSLCISCSRPIEETVFFGLPFYIVGNVYFVLVTGSVWVGINLFNTDTLSVNSLAFGNLALRSPIAFL